jgi:hypothetical protein
MGISTTAWATVTVRCSCAASIRAAAARGLCADEQTLPGSCKPTVGKDGSPPVSGVHAMRARRAAVAL